MRTVKIVGRPCWLIDKKLNALSTVNAFSTALRTCDYLRVGHASTNTQCAGAPVNRTIFRGRICH